MASQSIDVYNDRFESLNSPPKSWLLVLQDQPYLDIGDTLTVNEVTSLNVPTGRYMTAVCSLIHSGEFYNPGVGYQVYYFKTKSSIQMAYVPTIVKVNATISNTGNTNNNIIYSKLLPAGTFLSNDIFRMYARIQSSLSVNNKIFRVYFNTSNVIAGATQVFMSTLTNGTGSNLMVPIVRNMVFKNSLSSQEQIGLGVNSDSDEATPSNFALLTTAINFNLPQYFIYAIQNANAGDTASLLDLYGYVIR